MSEFQFSSVVSAPCEEVYQWHASPGALERLLPPWEATNILERPPSLAEGTRVVFEMKLGPIPVKWVAQMGPEIPGREFSDTQVEGPFHAWTHRHLFEPLDGNKCKMTDRVAYTLPAGSLGRTLGEHFTHEKLVRMFRFRHARIQNDLAVLKRYSRKPLRILIAGATGLVGKELSAFLKAGGHDIVTLTRNQNRASTTEIYWNPDQGIAPAAGALEDFDRVIHLGGEGIASARWSESVKARIISSRVKSTQILVEALQEVSKKPSALLCASAIGYYGDRPGEILNEASSRGQGFLAEVSHQWEKACDPLRESLRVVNLRTGIVLTPQGGALQKMLIPFRLALGAPLGDGEQSMSWIAIDDLIYGIYHALMSEKVVGPLNMVSPQPATNREFSETLADAVKRPLLPPVPKFVLRLMQGEMADALLFASTRVMPDKLIASGYRFFYPELAGAFSHLLGLKSQSGDT